MKGEETLQLGCAGADVQLQVSVRKEKKKSTFQLQGSTWSRLSAVPSSLQR